ncbi:ArsR family transcriptional regulator [Longispora urticae]
MSDSIELPEPTISEHLKVLPQAGLADRRRAPV